MRTSTTGTFSSKAKKPGYHIWNSKPATASQSRPLPPFFSNHGLTTSSHRGEKSHFLLHTLIGYFSLIVLPYLNSSAGTGIKAIAKNPSILLPHPKPSVSYILGPARGSSAPNRQRRAVMPAIADAAYCGKQSIMYVCKGAKMPMMPRPKGTRPMMGTIQWTW